MRKLGRTAVQGRNSWWGQGWELRRLLRRLGDRVRLRRCSAARLFTVALVICFMAFCFMSSRATTNFAGQKSPEESYSPASRFQCPSDRGGLVDDAKLEEEPVEKDFKRRLDTEDTILILVETSYSILGRQIRDVLDWLKFPYRVEVLGRNLPMLTSFSRGRFSLVILENYYKYINMDTWNRALLDKYCRDYGVGLMAFFLSREDREYERAQVLGFPLEIWQNQHISELRLARNASLLRVARAGGSATLSPSLSFPWLLFSSRHPTYEPVLLARQRTGRSLPAVVFDRGDLDGVRRILFGFDVRCWLVKLLLVDSIRFMTFGRLSLPLIRHIQIDIDDIFVGKTGFRMTESDVKALVAVQRRLARLIPGFKFNLGFSGKYFHSGNDEENKGDSSLLEMRQEFLWFPHMWRHNQAQRWNESVLEVLMRRNLDFAQRMGLKAETGYAVAPHHAGVYPVHEPLFSAWRRVWNVRVTSTEEYPHQKPPSRRRGFVHRDIMVLPRQTCGLYTHTILRDSYPGGPNRLDENIFGGDLFFSLVFSPISLFMTHFSNYARDRLALYTFEMAINFTRCWTNLQFRSVSPIEMAHKYFARYPDEKEPIWGNPCLDKKHLAIWSGRKRCDQLPRLLVLGPQKSGTTALYTFLKMHPALRSNLDSRKTFEELQFFSGRNYKNGLDWYTSFFPIWDAGAVNNSKESLPYFFEKSANYFDSALAPKRVKALIPDARLVAILLSPVRRAYSWYHHMRTKGDWAASTHEFDQVIGASENSSLELQRLRRHCLTPGMYAHHIEHWLDHFSSKQLLLLDGEQLKKDPMSVMNSLQEFLDLDPRVDFNQLLKFDARKGFYCQVLEWSAAGTAKTKCLGRGKGRRYPPMAEETRVSLLRFFRPHNVALHRLLTKLGYSTPSWLQQELQEAV